MIYFRKNDEVIEKYQVNFDKKEIEKLKNQIINKCSFIQHKEYESYCDYSPKFLYDITIRNFTYAATGKKHECFEETRDIYRYSYDEYKPPYLVSLMDQLLNGNSEAIDGILSYDISTKLNIDDRIKFKNKEFNEIAPENINKKKEKLKELEDLLKEKELNKNQQSIDLYYSQLMELIKFNLIDSLPISELDRIESFLEINLSSKVEKISDSNGNSFIKSLKNNVLKH